MEPLYPNFYKGYDLSLRIFFRFLIDTKLSEASDVSLISPSDLNRITPEDINAYIRYLKHENPRNMNENSIFYRLCALRAFFDYCKEEGITDGTNPTIDVEWPERKARKSPEITMKDIEHLFIVIKEDQAFSGKKLEIHIKEKLRDEALLRLLIYNNFTTESIVKLNLKDASPKLLSTNTIFKPIKNSWGRRQEEISYETACTILKYLKSGRGCFMPVEEDKEALFLSRKHHRLSRRSAQQIVKQYLDLAFEEKNITLYDLKKAAQQLKRKHKS